MIRVLITVSLLLIAAGVNAETRTIDGDTIVVDGTKVRLKGLSCAEAGTELGDSQTAFLKGWMSRSEKISCLLTGETTYDRQVGWCELDGFDIGIGMITSAYCQPCRRYDTTGKYKHLSVTGSIPNYCKEE